MKKFLLMMSLALTSLLAQAQNDLPDWDPIRLQVKEDYNAAANRAAWQAAAYLLTHPIDKEDKLRGSATRYVIEWMTGSPDYSFTIDAKAMRFAKDNDDWMALFLAGMVYYAVSNNAPKADPKLVTLEACKQVVAYAKNPEYRIRPNAEFKKMIKAADEGKLSEYLK